MCYTLQGAAPAASGDVTSAKSRAEHLTPRATAFFRVFVWAQLGDVTEVVTDYLTAFGLDAAAQDDLPATTFTALNKAVCCGCMLLCHKLQCIAGRPETWAWQTVRHSRLEGFVNVQGSNHGGHGCRIQSSLVKCLPCR